MERYEYNLINFKYTFIKKSGRWFKIYNPRLALVTEMVDLLQDFGYSGKKRDNDLIKRAFKKLRSYFGSYRSMKRYYLKNINLDDYGLSFNQFEKRGLTK